MTVLKRNAAQFTFHEALSGIGEKHPIFGDAANLYDHIGRFYLIIQDDSGRVRLIVKYFYPDNRTKYFVLTDREGNLLSYKARQLGKFLWQSFYPSKAPEYFVRLVMKAVTLSYLAALDSFMQPEGVSFEDKYTVVHGKRLNTRYVPDETTKFLKEDFNRRKKKYLLTAAGLSFGTTLVALRLLS